jgi:archaellum biogenesis ATPase FlaH
MTALEDIKIPDIGVGINTDREIIQGLKNTALEMCRKPSDHEYDLDVLVQQLRVACGHDDRLFTALQQGIEKELSENSLKRTIVSYRNSINEHFREESISKILSEASYTFRFNRDKIPDINSWVGEVIGQLEPLQALTNGKDRAVVSEIDLGDSSSMAEIFRGVKDFNTTDGLLLTPWQGLNRALDGGIRRGEFVIIPGLQHKYKTGITLSLFKGFAVYNRPYMLDPRKKPLLLRISFEDDLELNLKFLYENLKFNETRDPVTVSDITIDDLSLYVKDQLQVNGYHIKMMRVDPGQWTYRHICNKVIELEAQGYEIHVAMIDYLNQIPKTGCITSGPTGTDIRDLLRKMRNFFSAKKITCITPHQLSTEAKQLIRGSVPESQFVKEIVGKGYYDGCRQLDQEVDLEIYIHLFKHNRETWFNWGVGKHRGFVPPEEDQFLYYKFPKNKMPIPDDLFGEDSSFRRLPQAGNNVNDDLFKLA